MTSYKSDKNLRMTCEWKPEPVHSFNFDNLILDELEMPSLESSRELFCDDDELYVTHYTQEDYSLLVDDQSEANEFNVLYGTHYTQEDFEKFIIYREHYGIEVEDAIDYVQTCHCCNEQLDIFAGEYCSGGCHNHVEELGLPCFRGAECLICNRE